jgi:hypothetical protein
MPSNYFLGFGVDRYFIQSANLQGCVNDVRESLRMLTNGWGNEIRVPLEDCRPCTDFRAVAKGELFRLEQSINRGREGDHLFIAMSQHGAQIPLRDSEGVNGEVDRRIEVVCPYNFNFDNPETWITDTKFGDILGRLHKGARATVLLDVCHSGGMINDRELECANRRKNANRKSRAFPIQDYFDMDIRMQIANKKNVKTKTIRDTLHKKAINNVAVIFGCGEQQTCAEDWFDGEGFRGATTRAFWKALRDNPNARLCDIVADMGSSLEQAGYSQTPSLLASPVMGEDRFMGNEGQ